MKRSTFFLIAAIVAAAFGALMLFAPRFAAQGFNLAASGETDTLFRALGATLLALAVLNFLVRNHPASETLKAVLWTNVAAHAFGLVADLWSVALGPLSFVNILPGLIVHVVIGLGALYYATRMETA
jgi:hypothetical protein